MNVTALSAAGTLTDGTISTRNSAAANDVPWVPTKYNHVAPPIDAPTNAGVEGSVPMTHTTFSARASNV